MASLPIAGSAGSSLSGEGNSAISSAMNFANALTLTGINFGLGSYGSSKASRRAFSQMKDMLKHRHQWEVEDLRAAGLNPILSANAGGGANGFMAQSPALDIADTMSKGASSALARKQADAVDSSILLNNSNASKANAETESLINGIELSRYQFHENQLNNVADRRLKNAQGNLAMAQELLTMAKTANAPYERTMLQNQADLFFKQAQVASATARAAQREYDFFTANPKLYAMIQQEKAVGQYANVGLGAIGGAVEGVKSLGRGLKATGRGIRSFLRNFVGSNSSGSSKDIMLHTGD